VNGSTAYLEEKVAPLSDKSRSLKTPRSFPALLASDDLNGAMYQASLSPVMIKFT
jgi:hypothetical protein